jgi:hypothetical protein
MNTRRTLSLPMPKFPLGRCQLPPRDFAATSTHQDQGQGKVLPFLGKLDLGTRRLISHPNPTSAPTPSVYGRTRKSSVPNRVQGKNNLLVIPTSSGSRPGQQRCRSPYVGGDGAPINLLVSPASVWVPHPLQVPGSNAPAEIQTFSPAGREPGPSGCKKPPAPIYEPKHCGIETRFSFAAASAGKIPDWPDDGCALSRRPPKRPRRGSGSHFSYCHGLSLSRCWSTDCLPYGNRRHSRRRWQNDGSVPFPTGWCQPESGPPRVTMFCKLRIRLVRSCRSC